MRIVICDDDPLIVEELKRYILKYFESKSIKPPELDYFSNGKALLEDSQMKDIVFLDIEMPGINGIYVGNALKKANDKIIIFVVTSYTEYLDDAMRFHVFRYLTKPIDSKRLFRNLDDAIKIYHSSTTMIPIETKRGVHTILASSILAIEAQGRKVIVFTTQGNYESIHTMQYWLDVLPQNIFAQTHRSYIVNMAHITDFDHNTINIAPYNYRAYLTRKKYRSFKERYLLFLESMR